MMRVFGGATPVDYFYHKDDMGNVIALTDKDGAVVEYYEYTDYGYPTIYAPNGTVRSVSSVGNTLMWGARPWNSETQLYYFRYRWYDPAVGRFITRDPIGIWGDSLNNGNGYAYVGNNPWSMLDPFGLQSEDGIAEENARRCKQRVETLGAVDRSSAQVEPLAGGAFKSAGEAANPRTWAGGAKGFIIDGGVLFVEGTFNLVVHPIRSFNGAQDLATSGWRFSWEDDYRAQQLKELRKTLANSAASPASKRAASATAPVGAIAYSVALPTGGSKALKTNVSGAAAGETAAVATEATATATIREAAAVEAASGARATAGCMKAPEAAGQTYEITDGVRRAKAGQLTDKKFIRAFIYGPDSKLVGVGDVPIESLRSPSKHAIDMSTPDARGRFMRVLKGVQEGSDMPPIEVISGSRGIPLKDVGFDLTGE